MFAVNEKHGHMKIQTSKIEGPPNLREFQRLGNSPTPAGFPQFPFWNRQKWQLQSTPAKVAVPTHTTKSGQFQWTPVGSCFLFRKTKGPQLQQAIFLFLFGTTKSKSFHTHRPCFSRFFLGQPVKLRCTASLPARLPQAPRSVGGAERLERARSARHSSRRRPTRRGWPETRRGSPARSGGRWGGG